jgi:predicted PurR-regulated permease PerM
MADELGQPATEQTRDAAARVASIGRGVLMLLVFGLLVGVLAIVQLFMTAIRLFAQDQQAWGVLMIVWGVFVNTIDNFIKPWLISFGIEMPMSLTILGGFVAFGFLGLFIGPTLIAIMFNLVQAWRAAVSDHAAADVMKPAS